MHGYSLKQALSVWSDLEAALRGEHGYGGHVAEIYVYRLMPRSPAVDRWESGDRGSTWTEAAMEAFARANEDLRDLCVHFEETRGAEISVECAAEGEAHMHRVGQWLKTHGEGHRWHVRVEPKGNP